VSPQPTSRNNQNRRQVAEAAKQAQRRTRMIITAVVGVVIVAAIVVAALVGGGKDEKSPATIDLGDAAANAATIAAIPAATYDAVGAGSVLQHPTPYAGTPITKDGKPELLYIGAEYCPFCAAQRWAMVAALSRFGSFSNLKMSTSSAEDSFPNTPTFSFYGSSYSSEYLAFTAVETNTNKRQGNGYEPLEEPTDAQIAVAAETGQGGIPFLAFGGKFYLSGASLDPSLFSKRTATDIATSLTDTESDLTQAVLGAANSLTAAICVMTNNQPAAVCESPGVLAAKAAAGF